MSDPIPAWESMTGPEVADLVRRDPVVVLPLAATEQHGPHLPLSTDIDIGRRCWRAPAPGSRTTFRPARWPLLPIGASTEHAHPGLAGTLSTSSPATSAAVIARIGAAVAECGVRRLC